MLMFCQVGMAEQLIVWAGDGGFEIAGLDGEPAKDKGGTSATEATRRREARVMVVGRIG